MKQIDATVTREGKWWVFTLPELNTTGQAHTLEDVETEARNVAAMWLNIDPTTITITVTT